MLSPLNDIGACSSYGRNPSIGQRSLYAQERGGSNVTNGAFVAAETDGKKDLDNIIVGLHMVSDGIHTEMDVGLVSDNPENKLALEPVQQGDAEKGKEPSYNLQIVICSVVLLGCMLFKECINMCQVNLRSLRQVQQYQIVNINKL